MRSSLLPLALSLCGTPALAGQDLCQGNGVGGAYIEVGPAYLGGQFVHDVGSPNVPFGTVYFLVSDGLQPTTVSGIGELCLSVGSSAFVFFALPTDATGNVHFSFALPDVPSLVSAPPFHSTALTFEGGVFSVAKTTALYFQIADAWAQTQKMSSSRFSHTATALYTDGRDNEGRIFVAGGSEGGTPTVPASIATTEIFDPLTRSFTPGPTMSVQRAVHTATLLPDGRVLITGGMDATGVCHASCEIFDPTTGTLSPTGALTTKRAGHTASLLPDGRVLVAGGFSDYQNPGIAWADALNTAQATLETFDPATGAWTAVGPPMSSQRAAHTATLLGDGSVLLVGGVSGGFVEPTFFNHVPSFTNTVDRFLPATGQVLPEATLVRAVANHAAGLLPNGSVLVTGGNATAAVYSTAAAVSDCQVWDGASWTATAPLSGAVAWHSLATLQDGSALIAGGLDNALVGSSRVGRHDGAAYTGLGELGLNPGLPGIVSSPRGAATMTRAYDGTFVLIGGYSLNPFLPADGRDAFVYTPEP